MSQKLALWLANNLVGAREGGFCDSIGIFGIVRVLNDRVPRSCDHSFSPRCRESKLTVLPCNHHKAHLYAEWSIGQPTISGPVGAMRRPAEGIPLLVQGITAASATGWRVGLPFAHVMLAEVYAMARQVKEGLNQLSEAAKLVEMTQERWAEAEIHRQRGTLLLAVQERAEAEDSSCLALAVARRQSAKLWELRAAFSPAHLWFDEGKRTEAHDLLAPICGWFTEGFDTPVLRDAKALLGQLV